MCGMCMCVYLLCRLNDLVCQLEERERNSEAVLQSSDKEATLKQQALELHKKKVRVVCMGEEGASEGVGWREEGGRVGVVDVSPYHRRWRVSRVFRRLSCV